MIRRNNTIPVLLAKVSNLLQRIRLHSLITCREIIIHYKQALSRLHTLMIVCKLCYFGFHTLQQIISRRFKLRTSLDAFVHESKASILSLVLHMIVRFHPSRPLRRILLRCGYIGTYCYQMGRYCHQTISASLLAVRAWFTQFFARMKSIYSSKSHVISQTPYVPSVASPQLRKPLNITFLVTVQGERCIALLKKLSIFGSYLVKVGVTNIVQSVYKLVMILWNSTYYLVYQCYKCCYYCKKKIHYVKQGAGTFDSKVIWQFSYRFITLPYRICWHLLYKVVVHCYRGGCYVYGIFYKLAALLWRNWHRVVLYRRRCIHYLDKRVDAVCSHCNQRYEAFCLFCAKKIRLFRRLTLRAFYYAADYFYLAVTFPFRFIWHKTFLLVFFCYITCRRVSYTLYNSPLGKLFALGIVLSALHSVFRFSPSQKITQIIKEYAESLKIKFPFFRRMERIKTVLRHSKKRSTLRGRSPRPPSSLPPRDPRKQSLYELMQLENPYEADEYREALTLIHPMIRKGMIVITILVLFFGVWGTLAPLNSATVAMGTVVLDSNSKMVQHLEGGIISAILVKEGDMVKMGQPLMRLNDSAAKSKQELLANQLLLSKAAEARLIAERDNLSEINFGESLLPFKNDPHVAKAMDTQIRIFNTRKRALDGQAEVLKNRIIQLEEQIKSFKAQEEAAGEQLNLIRKELQMVSTLLEKGLAQRTRQLQLQRMEAELEGQKASISAQVARVRESVTDAMLQIFNLRSDYNKEVINSLREEQQMISNINDQLLAATDILKRTTITAPQEGLITSMRFHTEGGVIPPGGTILEIVPQNDKLLIEARIAPEDIDAVHTRMQAQIMLSAYKHRFLPLLNGTVTYVSADRVTDTANNTSFYIVRIAIDEHELENLPIKIELYPGMPAEAYIVTGQRTLLNYLVGPIFDSFHRAFREQ